MGQWFSGGSKSKQKSQSVSHQESANQSLQQSSSTSLQDSDNQAFGLLKSLYTPEMEGGLSAGNMIQSLLGLNGAADKRAAYANFRDTPGYDFAREEGIRAIDGSAASRGTLRSGATMKALSRFGTGLADQTYGQYMDRLLGRAQAGLQAGQLVGGAGNRSTSVSASDSIGASSGYSLGDSKSASSGSSRDKKGLVDFAGPIMASIPSDPRLKTDIVYVGDNEGLKMYDYKYLWDDKTVHRGYMADEVLKTHPEAVSEIGGYLALDYSKLPAIGEA